jgi:hypothetical protein
MIDHSLEELILHGRPALFREIKNLVTERTWVRRANGYRRAFGRSLTQDQVDILESATDSDFREKMKQVLETCDDKQNERFERWMEYASLVKAAKADRQAQRNAEADHDEAGDADPSLIITSTLI